MALVRTAVRPSPPPISGTFSSSQTETLCLLHNLHIFKDHEEETLFSFLPQSAPAPKSRGGRGCGASAGKSLLGGSRACKGASTNVASLTQEVGTRRLPVPPGQPLSRGPPVLGCWPNQLLGSSPSPSKSQPLCEVRRVPRQDPFTCSLGD